ncbi:hypothetical protein H3281_25930, partial [Escherichia coli]|nr:hypothetical protein [Escherichia coli]
IVDIVESIPDAVERTAAAIVATPAIAANHAKKLFHRSNLERKRKGTFRTEFRHSTPSK